MGSRCERVLLGSSDNCGAKLKGYKGLNTSHSWHHGCTPVCRFGRHPLEDPGLLDLWLGYRLDWFLLAALTVGGLLGAQLYLRRVRGIGPRTLDGMKPYLLPMPELDATAEGKSGTGGGNLVN